MRNNMMEQMYVQMMYSGGSLGGSALLTVTVLASLFLIVIFKPDRIHGVILFRWACTLAGLSILLPPLTSVLFSVVVMGGTGSGAPNDLSAVVMILANMSGPVLLGLSVLAAFAALRPRPARYTPQPAAPAKHPLD